MYATRAIRITRSLPALMPAALLLFASAGFTLRAGLPRSSQAEASCPLALGTIPTIVSMPSSVGSGADFAVTVGVSPTPTSSQPVSISTTTPGAFSNIPSQVTCPAGDTTVTFTVTAATVTTQTTAAIQAACNDTQVSGSTTVTP